MESSANEVRNKSKLKLKSLIQLNFIFFLISSCIIIFAVLLLSNVWVCYFQSEYGAQVLYLEDR